ncbi:MAG: class I SAM-dependent methyltransferase [Nocardioides sp.]
MPDGADADVKQGDALALPFADGEFDRVVAAEVLEHIPADIQAIEELVRVLRPGGTAAFTVPRWLPEAVCWRLSGLTTTTRRAFTSRIYTDKELTAKAESAGLTHRPRLRARGCTRRTGGSSAPSAWTGTTTRRCVPTTGCSCGTS